MFDLVFKHQLPRITLYHEQLKKAFSCVGQRPPKRRGKSQGISYARLSSLPLPSSISWVDDHDEKFEIFLGRTSDPDAISEAVRSGDSLENASADVSTLFEDLELLCGSVQWEDEKKT